MQKPRVCQEHDEAGGPEQLDVAEETELEEQHGLRPEKNTEPGHKWNLEVILRSKQERQARICILETSLCGSVSPSE